MTFPDGTVRTYGFDLDSNRTSSVENAQTVATYAYDATKLDILQSVTEGAQQRTFSYDTDGNTTSRGSDTLSWDGRGRHSGGSFSSTSVSYGFDATGFRRLRSSAGVTTHYRLGALYETTSGGTITNTDTAGPAGDLAHNAGPPTTGSTVSFLYYNGHGDLAAEANTSGTRTAAYTYDPFGNLRTGSAPANATSERWTGRHDKKLDTASSLVEMGARPYDPNLGRFLSVDPVEGGALNAYDFAGQEPTNGFDLTGMCYRGNWSAKGFNSMTAGSRAWLCAWVNSLHDECLGTESFQDKFGRMSFELMLYCWKWVDQWYAERFSSEFASAVGLWEEETEGRGQVGGGNYVRACVTGGTILGAAPLVARKRGESVRKFLGKLWQAATSLSLAGCLQGIFIESRR